MFLHDIVNPLTIDEAKAAKTRLDPKCWTGYHKAGTKVKGGTRVNNCVANEGQYPDTSNSIANRGMSQAEVPNVPQSKDGRPTVGHRFDGKAANTVVKPTITRTRVDRLDKDTAIPNFLKKGAKEVQVDEISFFQKTKPTVKKPLDYDAVRRASSHATKLQSKVVQNKDADEVKAREVHVRHADESYDNGPEECWTCRGTGEGQHEGQNCSVCHGTGVEPGERDDDDFDFDLDENSWPFKNGVDEDSWHNGQSSWSSEHDQWAHESLNEYPASASVPADSSSAIPGLTESQQQRVERFEIQWRLQEMKEAGYDI